MYRSNQTGILQLERHLEQYGYVQPDDDVAEPSDQFTLVTQNAGNGTLQVLMF